MERLETQPFIVLLCEKFSPLFQKVQKAPQLTLYHFKLIELLCHCMTLSSYRMLNVIKQSELFPEMINLMFKNPNCNIYHTLVERAIKHIIETDKKIFNLYRRYLFC